MTTRIYIDVDGVVNAFQTPATHGDDDSEGVQEVYGYWIRYSRNLVEKLNELHSREDVEFVWLTTWQNLAQEFLAPALGLSEWQAVLHKDAAPVAWTYYEAGVRNYWWKLDALRKHLGENPVDKFVWIDDEFYEEIRYEAKNWVKDNYTDSEALIIGPDPSEGLNPTQVYGMIEFIDAQ